MDKKYTFEEAQQYCSEYICKHYGNQYDNTASWDKWQVFSFLKSIQQKEIENGQVCYFRQNEQETKT